MTRSFPGVGPLRHGYHRGQVTEFVAQATRAYELLAQGGDTDWDAGRVRGAAFSLVRGGYDPRAVDRALDRLDEAFTTRSRADALRRDPARWDRHVRALRATLDARLGRPRGARFDHPRGLRRGYAVAEVDDLLDALARHLGGGGALGPADVRGATFASARGRRAYREGVVDAYLDRVVDVLLLDA